MFPFEPWVVGLHLGELGRWQITLPRDAFPPGPGDDEDDGNIEPPDDDDVEDDEDDEDEGEDDTLWARPRDWRAATHNDML